jgi:hypothetical protein
MILRVSENESLPEAKQTLIVSKCWEVSLVCRCSERSTAFLRPMGTSLTLRGKALSVRRRLSETSCESQRIPVEGRTLTRTAVFSLHPGSKIDTVILGPCRSRISSWPLSSSSSSCKFLHLGHELISVHQTSRLFLSASYFVVSLGALSPACVTSKSRHLHVY